MRQSRLSRGVHALHKRYANTSSRSPTLEVTSPVLPPLLFLVTASQQGNNTSRPQTAPAISHTTTNEARRNWQAGLAGHNDVFDYRYSSGICPPDMRVSDQ